MKRLVLAAAAAATMLLAPAAQATTFTFAQSAQQNGNDTLQLTNSGSTTGVRDTLSTIGTPVVNFWFFEEDPMNPVLPASLLSSSAYYSLNATSSSAALVFGSAAFQNFETGSLSFTRTTAAGVGTGSQTNLITINFTNMLMTAALGGNGATTISSTPGSTLSMTSDFFDFSMVNSSNFSLTISAAAPNLAIAANGGVSSFSADSTGSFASDPGPTYVPEPGMIGLFGFGALGLGFARRRK